MRITAGLPGSARTRPRPRGLDYWYQRIRAGTGDGRRREAPVLRLRRVCERAGGDRRRGTSTCSTRRCWSVSASANERRLLGRRRSMSSAVARSSTRSGSRTRRRSIRAGGYYGRSSSASPTRPARRTGRSPAHAGRGSGADRHRGQCRGGARAQVAVPELPERDGQCVRPLAEAIAAEPCVLPAQVVGPRLAEPEVHGPDLPLTGLDDAQELQPVDLDAPAPPTVPRGRCSCPRRRRAEGIVKSNDPAPCSAGQLHAEQLAVVV